MSHIFSPGKLLLTSEYAVLDGALALAVPTKPGQELFFNESSDGKSRIFWEAFHQDQLWLKAEIDYKNWEIITANLPEAAEFILNIFKNLQQLSPEKFQNDDSFLFKTNLQFPSDFGLGSSSTLMNNLAEWANADPFLLNDLSLGGSGYDIAVAKAKSPVLFQIKNNERHFEKINYRPEFSHELIFIHLKQKQNSREGVRLYREKPKSQELISELSEITKAVFKNNDRAEFSSLIEHHESILSSFLGIKKVKEIHFTDCPVFVKSLGAWGGDFVMSMKFPGFEAYFRERGFETVFGWEDLIN